MVWRCVVLCLFLCVIFSLLVPIPIFCSSSMAKRQKSIQDANFTKSRDIDSSTSDNIVSVHSPSTTQAQWKEQWALQFKWIDYFASEGKIFCKICRKKGGRTVYAKDGSKNFKVSAFTDHSRSNEHQRLAWASTNGEKTMEKTILTGQRACDETL